MLHQKKYRDEQQLFSVEGEKSVKEALACQASIRHIYATAVWSKENKAAIEGQDVTEVSPVDLQRICQQKHPNGVMAVIEMRKSDFDLHSLKGKTTIALESVRDPGNMGTIIRIADWFGIENILISSDCVERYNHKVIQSSMGGIFRIGIHEVSLPHILSETAALGIPLLGAVMHGESLSSLRYPDEGIILFGNESAGISADLQAKCSHLIKIEGKGKAESLNVGVAAGIITHWAVSAED